MSKGAEPGAGAPPKKRGGARPGSGRRSVSGEAGESAVLRQRVGQLRIDKLTRIAAMKGTTPGDMVRALAGIVGSA